MFAHLLSASFGYLDIAILVIVALFLILGLIRGIAKSFKGFFLTVAVMLLSLFLLGLSFGSARDFSLSVKLEESLTSASAGWGDSFNDPVYQTEDGLMALHSGELVKLNGYDGVKGKIANWLAGKFISEDGQSVAEVCVDNLTSFIVSLILFLLYCIALGIVCAIIRKVTERMHFSQSAGIVALDRIAGGVIAAGLSVIFILFVLGILAAVQDKIPSAIDYIENSVIGGFLYSHNPVAKVLVDIFIAK